MLQLLVREGTKSVTLMGLISAANDFQVPLPLTPYKVTFSANGLDLQGIDQEGRAESGIKLIRRQEAAAKEGDVSNQTTLQSFFQAESVIVPGLP